MPTYVWRRWLHAAEFGEGWNSPIENNYVAGDLEISAIKRQWCVTAFQLPHTEFPADSTHRERERDEARKSQHGTRERTAVVEKRYILAPLALFLFFSKIISPHVFIHLTTVSGVRYLILQVLEELPELNHYQASQPSVKEYLKMRRPTTPNLTIFSSVHILLLTALFSLPVQVQGFTCTAANATPSDPNGADPNQIAETGCRIFNSCTSSSKKTRKRILTRQVTVGASSITCPDTYGCYITNGGLFCLDLNSFDFITGEGVCGNVLTGSEYVCGSSGSGSGTAGGADSGAGSGSGSGSGSGNGGNSGSGGSGSGTGSGSEAGNGNGGGNGSGGGNGNGNGSGKPNAAGRAAASNGALTNSFVALVAFFIMLQMV
ncbi:hypothetical protein V8F20_001812 [Naviculisporaceae sp. PSN 640]